MKLQDRATNITINESGIIWNWNARHVLLDKFRLPEFGKLLVMVWVPFALILVSISVISDGDFDGVPMMLMVSGIGIGALTALFFISLLFVGHVFSYQFGVSDKSVYSRMFTGKLKDASSAAIVLGAMMENPGAMGAGMLAKADEYVEICYADMKKIRWYPDDCVIKFKGAWYSKPFYMNCPPQHYAEIEAKIRAGLAAAQQGDHFDS